LGRGYLAERLRWCNETVGQLKETVGLDQAALVAS